MLDLFCGRGGWTNAFLARGWECVGIDLNPQPEYQGRFIQADILGLSYNGSICGPDYNYDDLGQWELYGGPEGYDVLGRFEFICASSPCEEFSVHGMKHFHPNPKYPEMGIKLFNHTRAMCEESGVPYVMENVRPAQQFVGRAAHHCGPFYLWGSAVPALMPQGIRKNMVMGESSLVNELKRNGDREAIKAYRRKFDLTWNSSKSPERKEATAKAATIPPELANCVADYAERILAVERGRNAE